MCHALLLGPADRRDLDFREQLPMPLLALVVLAAAEFDDADLIALALGRDLRLDLAPVDQRLAYLDVGALADHQDLIELHGIADGGLELFDTNTLTLLGAVLLTACAKNGVHVDYS